MLDCLRNAEAAIAMEVLAAAQACELRAPLSPANGSLAAIASLRKVVPTLVHDRALKPDVDATIALVELRRARRGRGVRDRAAQGRNQHGTRTAFLANRKESSTGVRREPGVTSTRWQSRTSIRAESLSTWPT